MKGGSINHVKVTAGCSLEPAAQLPLLGDYSETQLKKNLTDIKIIHIYAAPCDVLIHVYIVQCPDQDKQTQYPVPQTLIISLKGETQHPQKKNILKTKTST